MNNQKITIHNVITGEIILREMTVEELSQAQADELKAKQDSEALVKDQADKAATRAAILTRLGLSSDELLALLS